MCRQVRQVLAQTAQQPAHGVGQTDRVDFLDLLLDGCEFALLLGKVFLLVCPRSFSTACQGVGKFLAVFRQFCVSFGQRRQGGKSGMGRLPFCAIRLFRLCFRLCFAPAGDRLTPSGQLAFHRADGARGKIAPKRQQFVRGLVGFQFPYRKVPTPLGSLPVGTQPEFGVPGAVCGGSDDGGDCAFFSTSASRVRASAVSLGNFQPPGGTSFGLALVFGQLGLPLGKFLLLCRQLPLKLRQTKPSVDP